MYNDSIIILIADHGEGLGENNYYFEHGQFSYDSCLRVPLIIKFPRNRFKGEKIKEPVALIDLYPTLLEMLDMNAPSTVIEGNSLLPAIEGRTEFPKFVFSEAGYSGQYQKAIRMGNWKLIYVPDPRDQQIMKGVEFELYNLGEDPDEEMNLAAQYPEITRKLKNELFRWMASGKKTKETRVKDGAKETLNRMKGLGYAQ